MFNVLVIIFLTILLIIAILYLFLLKRSIRSTTTNLKKKVSAKSKTLITSDIKDDDLSSLIETINETVQIFMENDVKLEIKNQNLQKMITNISHDLRTPLTSALGYIDLILNSEISKEDKQKDLKIVENRLKRLSELIDSFFEFSKIISNNKKPDLEDINIIGILEECIANHYNDFNNNKRIINLNLPKEKIKIKSNRVMLSRIFDNLIRNAYKHSKSDLDIMIKKKKNIEIEFSNELLHQELDISKMFDEFYTIDIARTKENTGLGLAIAKEFVEELGGKIIARKEKNRLIIIITF